MSQHDPYEPGPRHSQGRPAGARARTGHGEPATWPSEVPEPATVPNDWSPSGAYAGHHPTGYLGEPGGAPTVWDRATAAPGWSGHHPEPDPAASWNGNTTMGPAYRGSHIDPQPAAWNGSRVPDRIPAEWNSSPVLEPPAVAWNAPAVAWNAAPTSPSPAEWHPDPAPIDLGVVNTRTEGKAVRPDRTADRARRSPKLMMAAALAAAALAGGGVGAGLMAAFGGDAAATAPAGPGAGQLPGGQPPGSEALNGEAPATSPSEAAG